MDQTSLYEAIFKRKSVRNYDPAPLDSNRLEEVTKNLLSLKPIVEGIKTEFKIVAPDQVSRKLSNKAPPTSPPSRKPKAPTKSTLATCFSRWIFISQLTAWAAAGWASLN